MADDRELYDERHRQIMDALHGIHARLDMLNGRVQKAERDIAILHDRGSRGAVLSASIGAGLAAALSYFVSRAK